MVEQKHTHTVQPNLPVFLERASLAVFVWNLLVNIAVLRLSLFCANSTKFTQKGEIMKLFFDDHLLNEQKIEMAEDIMDKLIEKKHRLDAEKENLKQVTIHEESVTS